MSNSTALTVNNLNIPKDAESALIDAYRQDINEMEDVALLASTLCLTINIYEPSYTPSGLRVPLSPDQKIPLGFTEINALSQPKKSLGNGLPVVDLYYNKYKERYEILERVEKKLINRVGNTGEKEETLYYCMVKIKEPEVPQNRLGARVRYYKKQLIATKKLSDNNIREMLETNTIPGSHVEEKLQEIFLNREDSIKNIPVLIEQLDKEWQSKEKNRDRLIGIGNYLTNNKNLLLGDEPQVMTAEGTGYEKLSDWSQENIDQLYAKLQNYRIDILKYGYTSLKKWQTKEIYKKQFIKGNEDYKAMALVAILDDTKLDHNERFRLVTGMMTSIDPEKLKKAYGLIRGTNDLNKLENDIKAKFHVEGEATSPLRKLDSLTKYFSVGKGHKLQFPYLKSLLDSGQQPPSARLAMKLGLLYRGAQVTNLTQEQKDEIRTLVEEYPGELAALADINDQGHLANTNDEFLQAAYTNLKKNHTGFLAEIQTTLQQSVKTRPIAGIAMESIANMNITDGRAKYLIDLMYDKDKKQLRRLGNSITYSDTCLLYTSPSPRD